MFVFRRLWNDVIWSSAGWTERRTEDATRSTAAEPERGCSSPTETVAEVCHSEAQKVQEEGHFSQGMIQSKILAPPNVSSGCLHIHQRI